jgi:hypothetical protein
MPPSVARKTNAAEGAYEANEKVWKVLSQPWLALPLSAEGLRINLAVDMVD